MKKWFLFVIFGLIISSLSILPFLFKEKITNNLNNSSKEKAGSCLFLEEKYCKIGVIAYSDNKELLGIRYKLPNGTKIFSPIDGQYTPNVGKDQEGQRSEFGTLTFKESKDNENTFNLDKKYWYEFTIRDIPKSRTFSEYKMVDINKGDVLVQMDSTKQDDLNFFITVKTVEINDSIPKAVVDINELNKIINPN